jgi:hypothetical protein
MHNWTHTCVNAHVNAIAQAQKKYEYVELN